MSILTTIDGIPLFTTPTEALEYGNIKGLVGYHTHIYNGQTGYMGGPTHGQAASSSQGLNDSNQTGGGGQTGGY